MLVLTRKQNEEILIGDNVKITVLQVKGNSIRLGIEAPRDVRIVRGELPRQEPAPTKPATEHSVAQPSGSMADVTVVFSQTRESSGNQVEIVPFRSTESADVRERSDRSDVAEDSLNTLQFREALPSAFDRNRLQQIVNEVTGK